MRMYLSIVVLDVLIGDPEFWHWVPTEYREDDGREAEMLLQIMKRELLLRWRNTSETLLPCLFFLLVACLFPLAITPAPETLIKIGVGVVWVSVLLALFMALPQLFQQDYSDGSLDQLRLLPLPLSVIVFAKLVVQWVMLMLPLVVSVPLVAGLYHLDFAVTLRLLLSLLLGTPIIMLLGALLAGLTVGLRQQGLLLALLLFPLYVPTLIFASSMVTAPMQSMHMACALLGAMLLISVCLLPLAIAGTLLLGMNDS